MTMSWNEALTEYGIDFQVAKRPLMIPGVDGGHSQVVDNLYAIVRQDTGEPLPGVAVNGRYRCIQSQSYADIGNRITGELGAEFVKGGTLKGGRIVYLQAKMPECIRVNGTDDTIDKLLTFVNGLDGSTCFMLLPEAVRIFCENQMSAIRRAAASDGIKIKHTQSADSRLANADRKILEVLDAYRAFEVKVNTMALTPFTDAMMDAAMRKVFSVDSAIEFEDIHTRTKNNMTAIRDRFESGLGINAQNRGTAWAAFNAFTEYSDHGRSLRADTDPFESALIGSGLALKERALSAIELVAAQAA